jgi:hypothetical protein
MGQYLKDRTNWFPQRGDLCQRFLPSIPLTRPRNRLNIGFITTTALAHLVAISLSTSGAPGMAAIGCVMIVTA